MIITVSKPFNEVLESLAGRKKIFVVGCAACATKCQTGGEQAVHQARTALTEAGKEVTGSAILDTPCDVRIVKKDLAKLPEVKKADALLILACGGGVQAIEEVIDMPLYPALNPVFVGTVERIGHYTEYCALCGDCLLDQTYGICPVTRCAKSLINGPCGGAVEGKCEVDPERDCAWILIYNKQKKHATKANILRTFIKPRTRSKPRDIRVKK